MSCLQYYILKILRYLGWIYGILEITTVIYLTDWYMVMNISFVLPIKAADFLLNCLFLFYSDYKMSFRKQLKLKLY